MPAVLVAILMWSLACNKPKETTGSPAGAPRKTNPSEQTAEREAPKETGPYELQYIDTMSENHRGAVRMAQFAVSRANHAELKEFGGKLVADQERRIALLKEWRDQWYAGKPSAENRRMAGTGKSMADINEAHLDSLSGEAFDRKFLSMMIPHHQGAIVMAKDALEKVTHPELKALSEQIVDVQQKESDAMTQWQTNWGFLP